MKINKLKYLVTPRDASYSYINIVHATLQMKRNKRKRLNSQTAICSSGVHNVDRRLLYYNIYGRAREWRAFHLRLKKNDSAL